jgi:hypothetical protein
MKCVRDQEQASTEPKSYIYKNEKYVKEQFCILNLSPRLHMALAFYNKKDWTSLFYINLEYCS